MFLPGVRGCRAGVMVVVTGKKEDKTQDKKEDRGGTRWRKSDRSRWGGNK